MRAGHPLGKGPWVVDPWYCVPSIYCILSAFDTYISTHTLTGETSVSQICFLLGTTLAKKIDILYSNH